MTTTDAALLRAICADPADDVPRIMLADWLEEAGDLDRASLIRVQLELENRFAELERVRQKIRDGRRGLAAPDKLLRQIERLKKRERELLEVNWTAWSGVPFATYLANYHNSGAVGVLFRKGFVEAVTLPWQSWAQHHATLRESNPIREVTLTTWPQMVRQQRSAGDWTYWLDGVQSGLFGGIYRMTRHPLRHSEAARLLAEPWPGIEFTLPREPGTSVAGWPVAIGG